MKACSIKFWSSIACFSRILQAGIVCVWILFAWNAHAQTIQMSDILNSVHHSDQLKAYQDKQKWMEKSAPNTPLLEKVEGRFQTDFAEESDRRYSLRFYPTGIGVTHASDQLYTIQLKTIQIQMQLFYQEQLKTGYALVLQVSKYEKMKKMKQRMVQIYNDKITALNQSALKPDTKLVKILEAEEDKTKYETGIIGIATKLSNARQQIEEMVSVQASSAIELPELITVDKIRTFIQQKPEDLTQKENLTIELGSLKEKLAYWQYKIETCEDFKLINFIETSYQNGSDDDLGEAVRLEFGFRFPFTKNNQPDINRRYMSYASEQNKTIALKERITNQIKTIMLEINGLIKQYDLIQKTKQKQRALQKQLSLKTPLLEVVWQEKYWCNEIDLLNAQYDIYEKYIDLLELTGKIGAKPEHNFLLSVSEVL